MTKTKQTLELTGFLIASFVAVYWTVINDLQIG